MAWLFFRCPIKGDVIFLFRKMNLNWKIKILQIPVRRGLCYLDFLHRSRLGCRLAEVGATSERGSCYWQLPIISFGNQFLLQRPGLYLAYLLLLSSTSFKSFTKSSSNLPLIEDPKDQKHIKSCWRNFLNVSRISSPASPAGTWSHSRVAVGRSSHVCHLRPP